MDNAKQGAPTATIAGIGAALYLAGWIFLAIGLLIMLASPAAANVSRPSGYETETGASGPTITFSRGDLAFVDSATIPQTGWELRRLPALIVTNEAKQREHGAMVVWVRLRFERAALAPGPIALFTENSRERFTVYLNGIDIYRSYGDGDDRSFAWNRPFFIPLSQQLLHPGANEIILKLDSGVRWNLGVGTIKLGPTGDIQRLFGWKYFSRVTGVAIANAIMLTLTLAAFLFWLKRRDEKELLWLTLLGSIWFFRNLHFYLSESPFDPTLFHRLSICSVFFLTWALYGFCAEFLKVKHRNRFSLTILIIALLTSGLYVSDLFGAKTEIISYAIYLPVSAIVILVMFAACWRSRSLDHAVLLGAVLIGIPMYIHDGGMIGITHYWNGAGFYLTPYSSLIVFSAFLFSVGRRFLAALTSQNQLTLAIINTAYDAIVTMDYWGTIIEFNAAAQRMFYWRREEIIGHDVREFFPADKLAQYSQLFEDVYYIDEPQNAQHLPEYQFLRKDGSLLTAKLSPSKALLNGQWILVALLQETTASNAAAAELAKSHHALESQNRLTSAIIDSAFDCVITWDESGRITQFNPAAERTFGWSSAEIIGKTMEDTIFPVDQRTTPLTGMARRIAGQESPLAGQAIELRGLRRDGSEFPMEFAVAEAQFNDERIFIGYLRDLSARKADEAELVRSRDALHQSEKLAALGQLLAGVAHELNNPLAVVVVRASLLEEKLVGTKHVASLQKLRDAADRCGRIVKTFLAMARQTGPQRSRVQINDLVAGALDMTTYGLRNANVTLSQRLDPDLPEIDADGDQVIQVLINLIVNARHALEQKPGSRTLEIRTRLDRAKALIVIEAADNGPGVAPDIAQRIFDPFFTTKDVGEGTGLGLSVCKGIVEAHAGTLTFAATPGGGTTFRATLAVLTADTLPDQPVSAALPPQQVGGRALIVDDEPELAAILADCLAPLGIRSALAGSGPTALALLDKNQYDVIFCDVRMPGMDGIALHQHLLASFPALAKRLVFVSGDVLHRDLKRLKAASDRPLIEKPYNPQQVREIALKVITCGDEA